MNNIIKFFTDIKFTWFQHKLFIKYGANSMILVNINGFRGKIGYFSNLFYNFAKIGVFAKM